MLINYLIDLVQSSNEERSVGDIRRRLLKSLEEAGEVADAYLGITSQTNYKNRTWEDFREEACDTLIVLLDVALTPWPESNYPAPALIPNIMRTAKETIFLNSSMFVDEQFQLTQAIVRAEQHFRNNEPIAFFGAVSRGVESATKMCFALIPEDDDKLEVDDRVRYLFDKKINKWLSIKNKAIR